MLRAYILINGKKETVAERPGADKEAFKQELKAKGIKFDGVDKVIYANMENVVW